MHDSVEEALNNFLPVQFFSCNFLIYCYKDQNFRVVLLKMLRLNKVHHQAADSSGSSQRRCGGAHRFRPSASVDSTKAETTIALTSTNDIGATTISTDI